MKLSPSEANDEHTNHNKGSNAASMDEEI